MARNCAFSAIEINLLLELVDDYKDIIECKKTDAITSDKKEKFCKTIGEKFNAQSETKRDVKLLKKKYTNLKYKAKAKAAAQKHETYGTGGGPASSSALSGTEERMLDLLHTKEINGVETCYDCDYVPEKDKGKDVSADKIVEDVLDEQEQTAKSVPAILKSKRDARLCTSTKSVKTSTWAKLAAIKAQWTEEVLRKDLEYKEKVGEANISLIEFQKSLLQKEHGIKMKILEAQLAKELG